MRKEQKHIDLRLIEPNTGQLDWLPRNPRQWTQGDIDRTAKSIQEDPDFLEDRPLLVVPDEVRGGKLRFVVFAGNLRREGALAVKKLQTVPCVVYYCENPDVDFETVKRRAMKDNGSFGQWDYDELANCWDDLPLVDWGIPAWPQENEAQRQMKNGGLSTEGREGDEGYDEFTEKFKQKLTTDDCYTPPAVYDAVLDFVKTLTDTKSRRIIRPFYPGGNYENLDQYPKNCIVVDNPPFSILSAIVRFFCQNGIQFFIFAPSLTLFSAHDCDVTYIVANAPVTYENGAVVSTGFITNLIPDLRIWCNPDLREQIIAAQPSEDKTKQGFVYPDNIVTSAVLGRLVAHATELKIRKASCEHIKSSDSAEEQGRSLYGGGYIMSDRAAAERAAAERAAAERAAATRLNISARERAIIERLNEQDKE